MSAETAYQAARPDGDEVVLRLHPAGIEIKTWISYQYDEHFLTPSDGFQFVVSDERIDDLTADALAPGTLVTLTLNGNLQSTGYIDAVEKHASRGGGLEWTITGRDKLGQAVDSGIDPTTQFKATQTLQDLLIAVYSPFGWTAASQFLLDNSLNRKTITGQVRGVKTNKKGATTKNFAIHQLKPYAKEGAHQFASRVCERQGLIIWPTADGSQLIIGTPTFDQEALFTIHRNFGGVNNVLEGSVHLDSSAQPNVIVADGSGGGGEFGHSRLRSVLPNPCVYLDPAAGDYQALFAKYSHVIKPKHTFYAPMYTPVLRVMYLHDDESKTQAELDNFVYREMAMCVRRSLSVRYTVEGHGQLLSDGTFVPWCVDSVVDVQDDVGNVHEPLWVLSRRFKKSRSGGTSTDLELIRLYSLDLGQSDGGGGDTAAAVAKFFSDAAIAAAKKRKKS